MKLFVGSLSSHTDEDSLRDAFETYGDIEEVRVATDRDTGRSIGFGFITFVEKDAGQQAIEDMDGKELDGRTIKVNDAREGGPRGFGGGGGGRRW